MDETIEGSEAIAIGAYVRSKPHADALLIDSVPYCLGSSPL